MKTEKSNIEITIDRLPREIRKDVKCFLNKDVITSRIKHHNRLKLLYQDYYDKISKPGTPYSLLKILKSLIEFNRKEVDLFLEILEDTNEKKTLCRELGIDSIACKL